MPGPTVRLHCGDCLEILPRYTDASVDAIVTDPPYGIDYGKQPFKSHGRSMRVVDWRPIAGDHQPDGQWLGEAFRVMRDGAALYLCTRWDVEPQWRTMIQEAGFRVKQRL